LTVIDPELLKPAPGAHTESGRAGRKLMSQKHTSA
jgi:hypothetical protein